jgi:Putative Flp pilus-assembly TadE/G-like
MAIVWITLMIGLGVMFGMAALVVDVGYGMIQGRAMQNGADAAVLAGAKLLAGSVSVVSGGGIAYTVNNGVLHTKVESFADYNRPADLDPTRSAYPLAVEFRACPGQETAAGLPGAANFTFRSDPTLVAEVAAAYPSTGGLRQGSDAVVVPAWTCGLRVFARETRNALFASAIGFNSEGSTARATARILPTNPPIEVSDVWPVTRWVCNGIDNPATTNKDEGESVNDVTTDNPDKCDDDQPPCVLSPVGGNLPPCTFWDSNSEPQGSFKSYLDMSRFSDLTTTPNTRSQHLDGWQASCSTSPYSCPGLQYDTTWPGTNDKNNDIPYWIRNGWKGKLRIDPTDCVPGINPTLSPTDRANLLDPTACRNSRLEVVQNGNLGNNIASAMRDYIDLHKEGTGYAPAYCGNGTNGDFSTVTVFLWRWGEQDTANNNNSIGLTDQSKLWGYYPDDANPSTNDLKRVIVQRAARFRFCRGLVAGSNVKGFFVSWDVSTPPTCTTCPPSPTANTISLTE